MSSSTKNNSKSLIQYFTRIDDKEVTDIQNNFYVFFLSYIFSSLCFYCFFGNPETLERCVLIITVQCFLDLLLCKNEMVLHHICVIAMSSFMYIHNLQNIRLQLLTLIGTETSTIFFTARSVMKELEDILINEKKYDESLVKKSLEKPLLLVDYLFSSTFFITRIYLYSKNLIFNNEFNEYMMTNYTNTIQSFLHFYGANYLLYFLNVYWGLIITKKLFKSVKDSPIFHPKYIQTIIRYTYFIQNAIVLWSYTPFKYTIYYLDLYGNMCLSCSSYYFHNSIYEKLKLLEKERTTEDLPVSTIDVDRLDNDIIPHYTNDIIFIQMRMMFSIFVNFNPLQILYKNSIVYMSEEALFLYKVGLFMMSYSFMNCVFGLYNYLKFILTLKMNNVVFPYFHDKTNVVTTSVIIGMTMASTLAVVLYNTDDFQIRNSLFVVSVILTLMMYTQPFYQVSYLVTHIFLIYQTKLFCDANIFTNNGYFNEHALVET